MSADARIVRAVDDADTATSGKWAHADWSIDLGPGAGHDGGLIAFEGTPADLVAARFTLTGERVAA